MKAQRTWFAALVFASATVLVPLRAAADEGDAAMQRMFAACPGAARFILRGHIDLASLESSERAQVSTRPAPALLQPALHDELLAMAREDQHPRLEPANAPDLIERMSAIDTRNLARLKAIIKMHGLPTPAMVGQDGFDAA